MQFRDSSIANARNHVSLGEGEEDSILTIFEGGGQG